VWSVSSLALDLLDKLRCVQAPELSLRDAEHLPDDGRGILDFLEPLGRIGPEPQCGEGAV